MRQTGINLIGEAPWGTHFCQFYQTRRDLSDILVPYFKAGLEANEFCMWITSADFTAEEAESALRGTVPDFAARQKAGQIEILPHTEWYLKGGTFNLQRVLNGWVEKLDAALAKGFEGLRLTGNTVWLEKEDWNGFAEYEQAVNETIGRYRMMALCTYSLAKCGVLEVLDVVRNHQFALIKDQSGWEIIESSDEKRRRAEAQVRRQNAVLTGISRIFQEALTAETEEGLGRICLQVAEEVTQSRFGFVAELNQQTGRLCDIAISDPGWEACCIGSKATGHSNASPVGFPVRGLHGRVLLDGKGFFTNAPSSHCDFVGVPKGHPALRSFLAVPLIQDGKAIGVVGLGNRENGYGPEQLEMMESLAPCIVQALLRKRAEERTKQSEQRLNRSQEIARLGSWELDLVRNRLTWSDEAYRIFGMEPQAFGASYEAFLEAVHPEDRSAVDAAYSVSVRDRKDSYEIEHRVIQRRTGEVRVVHEKCHHVRNAEGKIVRSVGMIHDITEQKKAEDRIRSQNALLQGINRVFENALTCPTEEDLGQACLQVASELTQSRFALIGDLDQHGSFGLIAVSRGGRDACRMGMSRDGETLRGLKARGLFQRAILDGRGFFTNDPTAHPDSVGLPSGHAPVRSFLAVPLLNSGETLGLVVVANREAGYREEDLKTLEGLSVAIVQALLHKRAECALQEAQAKLQAHAEGLERTVQRRTAKLQESVADLEHFSYAITHDMRAPLRAMQGFADMIEEECLGCDRILSREYFKRIKIASARMDQLITDSLNYSKAVRQELTLEPVDLEDLLNGLVETYPNFQPDKADIEVERGLPQVMGNQAALTQCFSNLLGNAVKFCKQGARAKVRVRAQDRGGAGHKVRIWVEDNGVGIPSTELNRIFGIFERASKDRDGTGIGLAIVRKVVERMGGEVGVESEPGEGSRFWVDLKPASSFRVSSRSSEDK